MTKIKYDGITITREIQERGRVIITLSSMFGLNIIKCYDCRLVDHDWQDDIDWINYNL